MTKFKRILLAVAAVALSLSAMARGNAKLPNLFNNVNQVAMEQWVDSVFASLSPEARIGQLIVAAVTPRSNDATRDLVKRLVAQNLVGASSMRTAPSPSRPRSPTWLNPWPRCP